MYSTTVALESGVESTCMRPQRMLNYTPEELIKLDFLIEEVLN